ncbi:alpha/beta fold hydrolase [Nocardioides sp. AE5]|uniref:alpha/beta fold hydrolase n=1 Tax=Nocardioides sp. AE5 TaxID=2962573 RepID=UPI0028818414|nr:alpha/beta fold hydrolase [Nocardioides sp. AE5]MDT0203177.1 alpha/beta fold hydrolase [Nocardioides sp. AE5]
MAILLVMSISLMLHPPVNAKGTGWFFDLRGLVLTKQAVPGTPSDVIAHRVTYLSTATNGIPVLVTGLVMRPAGTPPAGGWPVVSWGHGTTGLADKCAPSRDDDYVNYAPFQAFLDAGYAVVATDYEGLGGLGLHPYLVAESEARSMIDMVRAADRLGPQFSDTWFSVGHSQGGHAAVAAGDASQRYGDGLDLRGTISFAPAPDASPIAGEVHTLDPFVRGLYVMMLLGLKTQNPRLDLQDYLGPDAMNLLPVARTECYEEVVGAYYELPAEEFEVSDPVAVDRLRTLLSDNAVPRAGSDAPLLILQGEEDWINPPLGAEWIAEKACSLDWEQKLTLYPDTGHLDITDVAMPDAIDWLDARLAGEPAPDDCPA